MKKLRETKKEALEQKKKLEIEVQRQKEIDDLVKQAQIEEIAKLQEIEKTITGIADENELFCGVILTRDDILAIVGLAMEKNESVKIPFKLYDKITI